MPTKSFEEIVTFYFQRFGMFEAQILERIVKDTQLILVIPSYNEANLLLTLESLQACAPPKNPVELILVINAPEDASDTVKEQNLKSLEEAKIWIETSAPAWLIAHVIYAPGLPKKYAGIGLARKIGMDEALRRFGSISYNGGIVCLDADCKVASNYFQVLERVFQTNVQSLCVDYEHQLDVSPDLQQGIFAYELHLRYYVEGLRYSRYPRAYHTIGSTMAVRASTYALSGGMNRRKAGEDFYFVHKIAPLGGYQEIHDTTVYPSARISDRVAYSTGKAQQKWQESSRLLTYHPQTFQDLKEFFSLTPQFFQASIEEVKKLIQTLPKAMQDFLGEIDFYDKLNEINHKSPQLATFERHYFAWMDGLKVRRFCNYLQDLLYPATPIEEATREFLVLCQNSSSPPIYLESLLVIFRKKNHLS